MKKASLVEAILLFLLLTLAFYMALAPRFGYPFPMHVDEWMHIGYSLQVADTGHLAFPDPFHAGRLTGIGHPEIGYYIWFGSLLLTTGVPWLPLSQLMPPLVLAIIAFASYAWGRKWGFGLEAALFVTFIHTTIRFLGPAYLVPVTLGLLFFPITLTLVDKLENDWRPLPLIILTLGSLFLIHGTTAVAVGFVLVVYLVFCLTLSRRPLRRMLPVLTCLLFVPFSALVIYLWNSRLVMAHISYLAGGADQPLPPILYPLPTLGFIMLALLVLGAGFLVARGGWRNYALLVSTAILLFFVEFYRRWFEIGPNILYERGWLYVMLLMALISGYGLGNIRQISLEFFKKPPWAKPLIYAGLGIVVALALVLRLDGYKDEYYYSFMDAKTYNDFIFIRDNLDGNMALLDPYLAWAFFPISGKYAHTTAAYPYNAEDALEVREFLLEGGSDTALLLRRGIDLIYSPLPLQNHNLVEVKDGIYILRTARE